MIFQTKKAGNLVPKVMRNCKRNEPPHPCAQAGQWHWIKEHPRKTSPCKMPIEQENKC